MPNKLTLGAAARLWWGFFWRAFLYVTISGVTAGLLLGTICWLLGVPLDLTYKIGFVFGLVAAFAGSVLGLKHAVEKYLSQPPVVPSSR
jgi:hypothetical protein